MEVNATSDGGQYEGPIQVIIPFGNVRKLVLTKQIFKNYNLEYLRLAIETKLSKANGTQEYPELHLYWIDDEGQHVEINSEEAYRKYLTIRNKDRPLRVIKKEQKSHNKYDTIYRDTPFVHSNVMCNGCRVSPIVGYRYSCIQCKDFDLCSNCEMIGKHSKHAMARVSEHRRKYHGVDVRGKCVDKHCHIQCKGCKTQPNIGFAFKCIEYKNFYLCEDCEKLEKYAEHLIIRLAGWHMEPIPKISIKRYEMGVYCLR